MTKGTKIDPSLSQIIDAGVSPKYYDSVLSDFSGPSKVTDLLKDYVESTFKTGSGGRSLYLYTFHRYLDGMGLIAACLAKIACSYYFEAEIVDQGTLCDLMMSGREDDHGNLMFYETINKDFLIIENVNVESLNKGVVSAFCKAILHRKKNNLPTVITASKNLEELCAEDAFGIAPYHAIDRDYECMNINEDIDIALNKVLNQDSPEYTLSSLDSATRKLLKEDIKEAIKEAHEEKEEK